MKYGGYTVQVKSIPNKELTIEQRHQIMMIALLLNQYETFK